MKQTRCVYHMQLDTGTLCMCVMYMYMRIQNTTLAHIPDISGVLEASCRSKFVHDSTHTHLRRPVRGCLGCKKDGIVAFFLELGIS